MIPEIITSYTEFLKYSKQNLDSLFWIVEYKNTNEIDRYSLLRKECLQHPLDFGDRLDNHIYRIWTTTPKEINW